MFMKDNIVGQKTQQWRRWNRRIPTNYTKKLQSIQSSKMTLQMIIKNTNFKFLKVNFYEFYTIHNKYKR